MKAAAIAEDVFAKNPFHPGAAHYMIHCYDDPIHAPLGLRAANVYAKIAPSASHAQHMPSHIYFALGLWEKASDSNIDAYESDKARALRKDKELSAHGYHAIWWLLYSKLQQGQYADASELIDAVEEHYESSDIEGLAKNIVIQMKALYALETQQWDLDIDSLGINPEDLKTTSQTSYFFVRGVNALKNHRVSEARKIYERLSLLLENSADPGSEVMVLELAALIQLEEDNSGSAIELISRANSIEGAMPMDFGPPWPMKPSYEMHGEILLQIGRASEAMQQFNLALARSPKRTAALLGLARSAELAGEKQVSLDAYRDLNNIWSDADSTISVLGEVRTTVQRSGSKSDY
jgi:tetratricopeptide (TPR) repeat protein